MSRFLLLLASLLVVGVLRPLSAAECDTLAMRIAYQQWSFPQEKIHVVTDRDAYIGGDTIRLRAWLLDAMSNTPATAGSRFVYAELVNPFGETVQRIKIRHNDDGILAGMIPLDERLPEGGYTLSARTAYMDNLPSDYYFRKPLAIKSALSTRYTLLTELSGSRLSVSLSERNSAEAVRAENISITGPDGSELFAARKRSGINLRLKESVRREGVVKVAFDLYEKFVNIPPDSLELSVTFHPEGGYMTPGEPCLIAFKALNSRGLSEEVEGAVTDSRGDTIVTFASEHCGMGAFSLTPLAGESYTARIDGSARSFALPPSSARAATIRADCSRTDSLVITFAGKVPEKSALIAHNCGRVTYARPIDTLRTAICRPELGSGIVQLLLVDTRGRTLSSRLIFNHTDYIFSSTTDSLPPGDYAVRSSAKEPAARRSASIVSNLLLQSELQGHIENPDYYFAEVDSAVRRHTDLLMLTQGWTRYDIPAALQCRYSYPQVPMEIGGEISGRALTRWRSAPLKGGSVVAIAPSIGFAQQAGVDSLGNFSITGIDWPDGTIFAIQALNRSGKREHNFEVIKEEFSAITPLPFRDETAQTDVDLVYPGAVMLNEVEITAQRTPEEIQSEIRKQIGIRAVTADDIKRKGITNYEQAIRGIPGLRIVNGNIVAHAQTSAMGAPPGGVPVELWIDGTKWTSAMSGSGASMVSTRSRLRQPMSAGGGGYMPTPTGSSGPTNTLDEFASIYPFELIESLEYYKPMLAAAISSSAAHGGGALVMTTRTQLPGNDSDLIFMKVIRPLGYQNAPEVYKPHFIYDGTGTDTTHAWYPRVSGLPASDSTPHVIIEGLTDSLLPLTIVTTAP